MEGSERSEGALSVPLKSELDEAKQRCVLSVQRKTPEKQKAARAAMRDAPITGRCSSRDEAASELCL